MGNAPRAAAAYGFGGGRPRTVAQLAVKALEVEEQRATPPDSTALHPHEMTALTSGGVWESSFVEAYECFGKNRVYGKLMSALLSVFRQISNRVLL